MAEAAERTGLSASHLRKLAREGKKQTQKVGPVWATTEAAVLAYIAEGHKPGPKPRGRRRQED